MLTQEFIDEMKAKLLAERDRLNEDLSGAPAHTEIGQEYDENAQEVEQDDVNADIRARVQSDLDKIEKALAKIEAGTYGTDDFGAQISEERLRALPWADQAL